MSAMFSHKSWHASRWPQWAAACNGVQPSMSWMFNSLPPWTSILITRIYPLAAATWSGVAPVRGCGWSNRADAGSPSSHRLVSASICRSSWLRAASQSMPVDHKSIVVSCQSVIVIVFVIYRYIPRICVSRSSNSSIASVSAMSIGSSPSLFTAATSDLFSIRYLIQNSKNSCCLALFKRES